MPPANPKRRACLIGVPRYDQKVIADLPVVTRDISRLQSVLEASDYRVKSHCPAKGEPDISLSRLRSLIREACRDAEDGETLILYFSGHGGHFQGKDCLVPCDADLRDPQTLGEYLLPVDVIAQAAQNCRAETVLFLVDACREGIKLAAKAIGLVPWNEEDRRLSGGRTLVTVLACARGEVAQFQGDEDTGYSLFTEALCTVLAASHPATRLGDVLEAVNEELGRLVHKLGKSPQTIWVLGETPADRRALTQTICAAAAGPQAAGPDPWSDAVRNSRLWPDHSYTGAFKDAAIRLAQVCWLQRQTVRPCLPDDPWVDDRLPVRLMSQLRALTSQMAADPPLSPAEAALLLLAPLVREAALDRARRQMADHAPLSLKDTGSGEGLRAALEKVHRAQPRMVRKAERLRETGNASAGDQVALWLMHRALLREPTVWSPPERHGGLFDGPVQGALADLGQTAAPVGKALTPERLLELARCCYGDPERISRRDRPGALEDRVHCPDGLGEHLLIRERLLGYLLAVAGAMALDPRLLSEVLVEHVGLPQTPGLTTLCAEIAAADWEPESAGRRLRAACSHPAADYALREQAEHANGVIAAALRAADHVDCAALAQLPARLTADGVTPASDGAGPAYRLPHLRFRLAQEQVLELLMGEQLYGDPALAIRELYQNALDACRYAQARLTYLKRAGRTDALDHWSGAIRFRQGTDDQGRPYIECEDNGIGMGVRELTETFTQAGRRFADTPEFIEEQTEWLAQDVRLYPNSQFGIGVLSYFMLADDFEVETCRMDREGRAGESLHAAISGSGNLVRLRPGRHQRQGTRVRLWLNRTEVEGKRVSVVDTLEELLWVAEFATEVCDGVRTLTWTAGRLGHDGNERIRAATCATGNPDFWWRAPVGSGWPPKQERDDEDKNSGFILSDGLLTESGKPARYCIANLRGARRPKLTVDRKRALDWDRDWLARTKVEQATALLDWDALCLSLVDTLAWNEHDAAERLWTALVERGSAIPVESAAWPILDEAWSRGSRPNVAWKRRPSFDRAIPLSPSAGFHPNDLEFIARVLLADYESDVPGSGQLLACAYSTYPYPWVLPRLRALAEANPDLGLSGDPERLFATIPALVPTPGDWPILAKDSGYRWPLFSREISAAKTLVAAVRLGETGSVVLTRLRALGFSVPDEEPDWARIGPLTEADRILLSRNLDGSVPWLEPEVPMGHVVGAAVKLDASLAQVAGRLRALGFVLPSDSPNWESISPSAEADLTLLSQNLDGKALWLEPEVPLGQVLLAATRLGASPAQIAARLRTLGFSLPNDSPNWESIGPLTEADRTLLSWHLDGTSPWLEPEVPLGHVLRAAVKLRASPAQIAARLHALGLTLLPNDSPDWEANGPLTEADWTLLSWRLDGSVPWLERTKVPLNHVVGAAARLGTSPAQIAARLGALGFALPNDRPNWESIGPLTEADWTLLSENLDGKAPWLGLGPTVPLGHVVGAAARQGTSPAQIAARLHALGLALLPNDSLDWEAIGPLTEADRTLLSQNLDGKPPWLRPEVPLSQVFAAAVKLGASPAQIAARLHALGLALLPNDSPDWEAIGPPTEADRTLLSQDWDDKFFWLDGKLVFRLEGEAPLGYILWAAAKLNQDPESIIARLLQLGFVIQKPHWPDELTIIVQIWHDCTREEAHRRLREAGWTPPADGLPAAS
ncbi:caspase family protein [uncultured Thiodictyon sp.]|jgi:hypothetical protein|uniref:wHTH domain-containing protein n=1 Tax=uncultured Thiodictyon sp. TaxID=1846217 RepID=UPI0025D5D7BD|nr:caspase family protein [uncultured Thiodictyon sp.]